MLIQKYINRNSICLISFFNLYELFPGFICANNIGSLVNRFFGVNIFNPALIFFFLYGGFNFNRIDNSDDEDPGLNNSSEDIPFAGVICLFFSIKSLKDLIDCYKLTKHFL